MKKKKINYRFEEPPYKSSQSTTFVYVPQRINIEDVLNPYSKYQNQDIIKPDNAPESHRRVTKEWKDYNDNPDYMTLIGESLQVPLLSFAEPFKDPLKTLKQERMYLSPPFISREDKEKYKRDRLYSLTTNALINAGTLELGYLLPDKYINNPIAKELLKNSSKSNLYADMLQIANADYDKILNGNIDESLTESFGLIFNALSGNSKLDNLDASGTINKVANWDNISKSDKIDAIKDIYNLSMAATQQTQRIENPIKNNYATGTKFLTKKYKYAEGGITKIPTIKAKPIALDPITQEPFLEERNAATNQYIADKNANPLVGAEASIYGMAQGIVSLDAAMLGDLLYNINNNPKIDNLRKNTGVQYAMGGEVPVEVEGGEVARTPNDEIDFIQGANHEQGGVNETYPEGTEIFSKRVTDPVTGQTMANKEKMRIIKEAKAKRQFLKINNKPTDIISKRSYQKTMSDIESERQNDLAIMEYFRAVQEYKDLQQGQQMQEQQTAALGRGYLDDETPYSEGMEDNSFIQLAFDKIPFNNTYKKQAVIATPEQVAAYKALFNDKTPATNPFTKPTSTVTKPSDVNSNTNPTNTEDNTELSKEEQISQMGQIPQKKKSSLTLGDKIGIGSTMFSGLAGLATTVANRAGTKKPVNWYDDLYADSLSEVGRMEGSVEQSKQQSEKDIIENANATDKSLQNSARSVNTLRALKSSSAKTRLDGLLKNNEIYNNAKNNLRQLKMQISQARELAKAKGKENQYTIEEQQRDNFYTNLGINMESMGKSGRHLASTLNQSDYNNKFLSTLNSGLSNIQTDAYGNFTPFNNSIPNLQNFNPQNTPNINQENIEEDYYGSNKSEYDRIEEEIQVALDSGNYRKARRLEGQLKNLK